MRYLVILNPFAGGGKGRRYLKKLKKYGREITKDKGIELDFVESVLTGENECSLKDLAANAAKQGYSRVISAGGDGTHNRVANGLAKSNLSLGFVPVGTANDIAFALSVPKDPLKALEVAIFGREIPIDLIRVRAAGRESYCINTVSFGLDAEVVRDVFEARKKDFSSGKSLYVRSLFKKYFSDIGYPEVTLSAKGCGEKELRGRITVLAVANGPQYGGMLKIAPAASFFDGLLNVCWIGEIPKYRMFIDIFRLLNGTHEQLREVEIFSASSMVVFFDGEMPCQGDGEHIKSERRCEIDVIRNGVTVVTPESFAIEVKWQKH